MITHVFLGEPFSPYVEEAETKHPTDFNAIDMDNDGALNFDEADGYAPDIDYSHLSKFFDEADKNDNCLLIGGEFDWYLIKIDRYYKDLENQENVEEDADHEKSESPSSSIPTVNLGKCPSCGSDASYMYEYYDEFDRPIINAVYVTTGLTMKGNSMTNNISYPNCHKKFTENYIPQLSIYIYRNKLSITGGIP